MQDIQDSPEPASTRTPWTDYVEAVWRWRRFVVVGTLAAWATIALLAFLVPKQYECQGTISLPGAAVPMFGTSGVDRATLPPDASALAPDRRPRPGITLALYKRLQRALADRAVVEKGLGGRVDAATVQAVLDGTSFSPISSGPRNDLARFETEDRVVALQISHLGYSPAYAREVVSALASLARDALLTVTVLDQIETDLQASSLLVRTAQERMHDLQGENESLAEEQADIARLVRESPPRPAETLAIIDATGGGYRYLPPQAQLVGIKSKMAHNRSRARQIEREVEIASLHLAHLHRLDQAFRVEFERRGCQLSSDPVKTIRGSLDALPNAEMDGRPALTYLRADLKSWADMLALMHAGARFIQEPTLGAKRRGLVVLATLAASVLFVLGAALLGESWQRHRAARSLAP
jgi:hypothetical protein